MRFFKATLWWTTLILAFVPSACGIAPQNSVVLRNTPTQASYLAAWQLRWLKGIPCRPPCWEGITPGKTSPEEALKVLEGNSFVKNASIRPNGPFPNTGIVFWDWSDGSRGGFAYFHTQVEDRTIYALSTRLPASFKLSEVMTAYGEPSHVVATAGRPDLGGPIFKDLRFVYLNEGFYVAAEEIPKTLTPEISVHAPTFFVPSIRGALEGLDVAPVFLIPWQGWKNYDFYCRDSEAGKACKE